MSLMIRVPTPSASALVAAAFCSSFFGIRARSIELTSNEFRLLASPDAVERGDVAE